MSIRPARLLAIALAGLLAAPAAIADRDSRHSGYFHGETNSGVIIYYGTGHGGHDNHFRPSQSYHHGHHAYQQGYREGYRDGFRDSHRHRRGNAKLRPPHEYRKQGGRVSLFD